ncbi:MAG: carbonic anhydrase family protein [bacterium]
MSPSVALQLLKEGNQRFLSKKQIARDLLSQVNDTATGQFPFAAILGCIDSRVPAEVIFDQGIGDLFNTRIAGNFVNDDILGSLEFACKVAGSKLILVLGHTHCGAVKGACDNVELGNLTGMLQKIKPAIDSVTDIKDNRNSSNKEFVQKVADKNVAMTIENIKSRSTVLREMYDSGEIDIVGGMYDIHTGKVSFDK